VTTGMEAVRYAAANARVRGLYAKLLSDATWQILIEADGFEAALAILRDTDYLETVRAVEQTGSLSLERLERLLLGRTAADHLRAARLVQGSARGLMLIWWQRFELENLKTVFRGIESGLPANTIETLLVPLGEHATLPWDVLTRELSVAGLIDRLANTHYTNPLKAAYPQYERQRTLFPIEIALDIRYYRDLYSAVRALRGAERCDAVRQLGTWLDALNILWAFRHRDYYGLSAEEIVNYTLWHTERTDVGLIREIALGATPYDTVLRVFGRGKVDLELLEIAGSGGAATLPSLELSLYRYRWHLARQAMGGYPFSLGAIIGYLVLADIEIRDLVMLLEAKRMGWEASHLQQSLVRHGE